MFVFFFKQKTAYEMRISDWSSDVCSSDLAALDHQHVLARVEHDARRQPLALAQAGRLLALGEAQAGVDLAVDDLRRYRRHLGLVGLAVAGDLRRDAAAEVAGEALGPLDLNLSSEEPSSELQSPLRNSNAVFRYTPKPCANIIH